MWWIPAAGTSQPKAKLRPSATPTRSAPASPGHTDGRLRQAGDDGCGRARPGHRSGRDGEEAGLYYVGDRRRFVSAVIIPDFHVLTMRLQASEDTDWQTLVTREDVRRLFGENVESVNADLPDYESIRKFVLLPTELSIASGELTPSLKVKRRVVMEKWGPLINELYAGE